MIRIADVAIGGNEGPVLRTFRRALGLLDECGLPTVAGGISPAYRNPAWVLPNTTPQPDHWNAVLRLECAQEPRELLQSLQQIEAQLGRIRREKWAARPIDLDILRIEKLEMATDELVLPHPALLEREFFYWPLAMVDPDFRPPTARRMQLVARRDRWW